MAGKHTENEEKNVKRKGRKGRKGLKIFGIILLILVLLVGTVAVGAYWYINDKFEKMQQVEIKEEELKIDEQVEEKVILDYINTLRLYQTNREIKRLEKILKEENDIMIQASIAQKIAKLKQEI